MWLLLKILVFITLFVIFIQDLKSRAVYWVVFPILLVLLGVLHYIKYDTFFTVWRPALINLGFLTLQILLVSVYFSIKSKRLVNTIDGLLGLGDILFLLSVTVYLSVLNFLFFYVVSLVLVLLAWLLWQSRSIKTRKEIPLAGMQALILIVFLSCDWWLKMFDLTDDTWLINLITK
jgi:hypothetical protein